MIDKRKNSYENAFHFILGMLYNKEHLSKEEITSIALFIKNVLETDSSDGNNTNQIIKG